MKQKGMVQWSIVLGLALILLATSSALAATGTPLYGGSILLAMQASTGTPQLGSSLTTTSTVTDTVQASATPTATMTVTVTLQVSTTPTATATVAPTPTPAGTSPETAREPSGEWGYISANSSIWFKMQDAGLQLEVWVDANGQSGLELAIFAPEQKDLYNSKPVGRGSFNKFLPSHDLFWTGRTSARGTWYALLTSNNNFAVSYSLGYKRTLRRVSDACAVCHGYEYQWWDCEPPGSPGCINLENEYNSGWLQ